MSQQVCFRAITCVYCLAVMMLLCLVIPCNTQAVGRTKRAAKSAFTEPGVIIGIIVGVTGVLVVVGVTILLCRLFCCKHSSCCGCCERGEAYQEASVVLPRSDKSDSSTLSHSPPPAASTHQPTRPRKSGRGSKATPQNPPDYDEVSKTGNWKVLDVKKYLQQSLETDASAKDSKDSAVNNTVRIDSPRPLKYDFDDLENSPVASRRNKREPAVKSLPSPASSETTVGDFSGREEDRHPICRRREQEPVTGYSISEFPSNAEELQNSGYQTRHDRDSDHPPSESRRVLAGVGYSPQTANMADTPPGPNPREDYTFSGQGPREGYMLSEPNPREGYTLSPEHEYSTDNVSQPSPGAKPRPASRSRQPQPAANTSDHSHRSPRVMTRATESYKSWDFDPSYCDGRQRVWDGKGMKIRDPMEDLADPRMTTTHQHSSLDSSYADSSCTDNRPRFWAGAQSRVPNEASVPAENYARGKLSPGRSYGGAVNMAYNEESTETTV